MIALICATSAISLGDITAQDPLVVFAGPCDRDQPRSRLRFEQSIAYRWS
jgi:hypothetical protein